MNILNRADKLLGHLVNASGLIGLSVIGLMMVQITVDVISKHLTGYALPATITTVANYYMVLIAFLPIALAERRNAHISVEVVYDLLPRLIQRVLLGLSYLYSALVFSFLAYQTWFDALKKMRIGSFILEQGEKIPIWPAHFLLPLGSALMVLTLLVKFALFVTGRAENDAHHDTSV